MTHSKERSHTETGSPAYAGSDQGKCQKRERSARTHPRNAKAVLATRERVATRDQHAPFSVLKGDVSIPQLPSTVMTPQHH